VKLAGHSFLDFYPAEPSDGGLSVPTHFFCTVALAGDSLQIAYLDEEWLKARLMDGSVELAHETVDDGVVLTASTQDLQRFAVKYADDREAFADPGTFHHLP
jgi:hypothetical protein